MADDENRKNDPKVPNNLFLLSPKFELKFPPFMKFDDSIVEDREETSQKPDVVRFADPKPVTPPPLKLYNEELEKRSHPLILFPVYALGGFLILKWVWARLKERNERAKKESSGDDNRSSDEYELPSYDSE
ncbi:uncharacterized protein LOC105648357 isoform X2 [Jatropha curcas]|uniref:uncharacterized protein LOC105648357 isoform X2 n=1 Tax=Jatropha curcas TaxID=180498 RepID=UPI0018933458|nr:uncharacterized protein LOC105648357 isoform X2 [Jatropha curcas]